MMIRLLGYSFIAYSLAIYLLSTDEPSVHGSWVCEFDIYNMAEFKGRYSVTYFKNRDFLLKLDGEYLHNGHPILASIDFSGNWWEDGGQLMRQVSAAVFVEITYRGIDVPESVVPPSLFDEFLSTPVHADIVSLEEGALLLEDTRSVERCGRF